METTEDIKKKIALLAEEHFESDDESVWEKCEKEAYKHIVDYCLAKNYSFGKHKVSSFFHNDELIKGGLDAIADWQFDVLDDKNSPKDVVELMNYMEKKFWEEG